MWPFKRKKRARQAERVAKQIEARHSAQHTRRGGRDWVILRHCPIPKEAVLSGDLDGAEQLVRTVTDELRKSGTIQPWNMTISGYGTDPRGLWQIPEVRRWATKAQERFPFLPWFLSPDSVGPYLFCLLDIEVIARKRRKLSTVEQEVIDAVVDAIAKNDPQAAKGARESFEYEGTIRIKSLKQKANLVLQIILQGTQFLTAQGLSQSKIKQLMREATERIQAGLAGHWFD